MSRDFPQIVSGHENKGGNRLGWAGQGSAGGACNNCHAAVRWRDVSCWPCMRGARRTLRGGELVLRWLDYSMSALPETRLITKVATLYHEQKLTQTDIAKRLGVSQVTVSRLLKRAEESQIVRTTVISPPGAFVELEDMLEKKFGLTQAIVAESQSDTEESVQAAVGAAAAYFLMTTLSSGRSLVFPRGVLPCWRWLIRCIRCARSSAARWFKYWEVSAIRLRKPTRTTW